MISHTQIIEIKVQHLLVEQFPRRPRLMARNWLYFNHVCIMIKTNGLGLYCSGKVMNQISTWERRWKSATGVCSFDDQWDLNMQSVDGAWLLMHARWITAALWLRICEKKRAAICSSDARSWNRWQLVDWDVQFICVWVIYLDLW